MNQPSYQIKLPQFEGPFDLLLFFIERDELDVYNIPITRIIKDDLSFDEEAYKAYSPLFLSTTFAISYGLSFASITATLT